eukprot:4832145-Ditylum_brightwellii.AAC.1
MESKHAINSTRSLASYKSKKAGIEKEVFNSAVIVTILITVMIRGAATTVIIMIMVMTGQN